MMLGRLLCLLGWHAWDYGVPNRRRCIRCGQREYREDGCWMVRE